MVSKDISAGPHSFESLFDGGRLGLKVEVRVGFRLGFRFGVSWDVTGNGKVLTKIVQ